MADSSLNFNSAQLQNSSVEVAHEFQVFKDALLPGLGILAFVLSVWFSVVWVKKKNLIKKSQKKSQLRNDQIEFYQIKNAPALLKLSLLPTILAFALTHVFSAISVYYNTKIINPSTEIYFQALGVGRLSSLSHAHFFAHATMYFIMAVLVQMAEGCIFSTVVAPLLALWSGIFDVVSWWGIKLISPNFEYLSMLTGMSFSLSFIFMASRILKAAFFDKS